jgi:hypothetical protein
MPLQDLTAKVRAEKAHLFALRNAALKKPRQPDPPPSRTYAGSNPPDGAVIHYLLRDKSDVTLEVADGEGNQVAKLAAPGGAGLQRVVWDLRKASDKTAVTAGEYVVRLTVDGKTQERKLRVTGP